MKKISRIIKIIIFICISTKSALSQDLCSCPNPCVGNVLTEGYDLPGSWTYTNIGGSTGSMTVAGSAMNYNDVTGNGCNRMSRPMPTSPVLTNATGWRAECKVQIIDGNAPRHYIMAFTRTSEDPLTGCLSPFTLTKNAGIFVTLDSPNTPTNYTCCTVPVDPSNRWRFQIQSRDPFIMGGLGFINVPSGVLPANYYVRLVVHGTNACLSVFSNPTFTGLIGSVTVGVIPSAGYNYLQHGVVPSGAIYRRIKMNVDNMRICDYSSACNFRYAGSDNFNYTDEINHAIIISPNPTSGMADLEIKENLSEIIKIVITDISGREVKSEIFVDKNKARIKFDKIKNGIYFVEVFNTLQKYNSKIIVRN